MCSAGLTVKQHMWLDGQTSRPLWLLYCQSNIYSEMVCPRRIMKYTASLLQHLPSLFVLAAIVGSFVFGTKLSTIPFVLFGTYSAWVYLRFLQLKPDMSIRCAL